MAGRLRHKVNVILCAVLFIVLVSFIHRSNVLNNYISLTPKDVHSVRLVKEESGYLQYQQRQTKVAGPEVQPANDSQETKTNEQSQKGKDKTKDPSSRGSEKAKEHSPKGSEKTKEQSPKDALNTKDQPTKSKEMKKDQPTKGSKMTKEEQSTKDKDMKKDQTTKGKEMKKDQSPKDSKKDVSRSAKVENITVKSENQIEMIITIPYLLSNDRLKGYTQSLSERNDRMDEYILTLTRSLSNKYISKIHILYTPSELKNYIINKTHDLSHNIRQKLQFHQVANDIIANVALELAYQNLQDKIVMITQADCYPHSGFELIDKEQMLKHNVMYALTRHGQVEKRCDMSKQPESTSCDVKRYMGSHDTYIFVPRGPLSKEAMKTLNHPNHFPGIDNVMVFTFKNILKFNVLNSCLVIRMNHLHCVSGVRNTLRSRINNSNNSGHAKPTSKLIP